MENIANMAEEEFERDSDSGLMLPRRFYRNRLPHFQPDDCDYAITYRLAGSIPKSKLIELQKQYANANNPADREQFFQAYDDILDANGPYHLNDKRVLAIVRESLEYLNERDIFIWAYCVMSNHVHLVCKLRRTNVSLHSILQRHKSHTGRLANGVLGTVGMPFWQRESYDHVVRHGRLGYHIEYAIMNPVKAGFVTHWRDWPGTYLAPECYGF